MRLVLATGNAHKAEEVARLLAGADVELVPRPAGLEDPDETGSTFLENARIKARAVVEATGEAALADDSGLEVDALDGAPGVLTARYGGWERLLDELTGVGSRSARFRCVVVVARPDGTEVHAEGSCEGTVALYARGEGGFGYDPVFVPADAEGRTFAELTPDEKDARSHRASALAALLDQL